MKKFLLPLLAIVAMCFAGCNKEGSESENIKLERKVVLDGKTFPLALSEATVGKENGTYSITSEVDLDGYATMFMVFFHKDLIGKTLEEARKSNIEFAFVTNGILPYKDEVLYGGEIFISNRGGELNSGFKSVKVDVVKSGDAVSLTIDGTLEMGAHFTYQNYVKESEITTY